MGSPVRSGGVRGVVAALSVALALLGAACGSSPSAGPGSTTSAPTTLLRAPVCPTGQSVVPGGSGPEQPSRPGQADILVPLGPSVATVCRYGLSPSATTHPVRSAVVRGADLEALVSDVDSTGRQVISPTAVYSCPASEGGEDVVLFAYPTGPGVRATVAVGGCEFVSNGVRTAHGDDLVRYLARWVGVPAVLPA